MQSGDTLVDGDDVAIGGGVAFGVSNQIPHMNTGGTDFDYDANLTFDGTNLDTLNVGLPYTDDSSTGIIRKDNGAWLHDFSHPTGSTQIPLGNNIMLGEGAGNFTMGSTATSTAEGSNNILIGRDSGTAMTTGYQNTFIGTDAGKANTTGLANVAVGHSALSSCAVRFGNTAVGPESMKSCTTGYYNTALGAYSLDAAVTGYANTALGYASLGANTSGRNSVSIGYQSCERNTTGIHQSVVGTGALQYNIGGHFNSALGTYAGRKSNAAALVTAATDCIYIGYISTASSTTPSNEIVIGNVALGQGDDTVMLGNDDTTDSYIAGDVHAYGGDFVLGVFKVTVTSFSVGDTMTYLGDTDTAGADITMNLPAAAGKLGVHYNFKKLGTGGNVIIDGNGSETIDGSTTVTISVENDSIQCCSDGTNWHIV